MNFSASLPLLPPRSSDSHKGTFGTVLVIGGQAAEPIVMVGGPAFTAIAALRSGCGLVKLALPAPLVVPALTLAPSATGLALPVDGQGRLRPSECAALLDESLAGVRCIAVGPGLGAAGPQQQVVLRLIAGERIPLVLDADALNCLAQTTDFARDLRAPAVLTPHPREFARLAEALSLCADTSTERGRVDAATALARRLGSIVVLKGAGTVVTDGLQSWICRAGNAALATAGTGDVLTGVIAGFVAQFATQFATQSATQSVTAASPLSIYDCARLAVEAHARAADRWRERGASAGMLASDLLEEIPAAVESLRRAV